jgi:cyanophycin synthetase
MMHPENIFLAERISRVIGLDVCVGRYMAENLTQPLKENGGVILKSMQLLVLECTLPL